MNLYEVVAVEIQNAIPRMLTQLCRDQEHPLYGSFDRDHWHYKIRDFSSMVLHQGVILIDLLAEGRVYLAGEKFKLDTLSGWRDGCLKFWAAQPKTSHRPREKYRPRVLLGVGHVFRFVISKKGKQSQLQGFPILNT